jgi:hypothetical protein
VQALSAELELEQVLEQALALVRVLVCATLESTQTPSMCTLLSCYVL